jgi:hypothetical protein
VLPSGQTLTSSLVATITLKVVFRTCSPFPALVIFWMHPESQYSVRVFNTACDSTSNASIELKWKTFSFIFNLEDRGKSDGWRRQSCCFWSKIPWWKRKCEGVSCRDATARSFVAKFRVEIFAHFHAVVMKGHSNMRNWKFGLPGRILCEQSLYINENDEHALDSAFRLSRLFRSRWVYIFRERLLVSSPNEWLIFARVSVEICTKFDAVPFSGPSRNRIRPDTRL